MAVPEAAKSASDDHGGTPVPPELHAAIERGIADAKGARTQDGTQAVRDLQALMARLRVARAGKAGA